MILISKHFSLHLLFLSLFIFNCAEGEQETEKGEEILAHTRGTGWLHPGALNSGTGMEPSYRLAAQIFKKMRKMGQSRNKKE